MKCKVLFWLTLFLALLLFLCFHSLLSRAGGWGQEVNLVNFDIWDKIFLYILLTSDRFGNFLALLLNVAFQIFLVVKAVWHQFLVWLSSSQGTFHCFDQFKGLWLLLQNSAGVCCRVEAEVVGTMLWHDGAERVIVLLDGKNIKTGHWDGLSLSIFISKRV